MRLRIYTQAVDGTPQKLVHVSEQELVPSRGAAVVLRSKEGDVVRTVVGESWAFSPDGVSLYVAPDYMGEFEEVPDYE